jgi:formylglycine-generating enzyme required for sulfatase activity
VITLVFLLSAGFVGWIAQENMSWKVGAGVLLARAGIYTPQSGMVKVPAGSFQMGSPKADPNAHEYEFPQHLVTFRKPFLIGKYEVTFDEYDVFARLTRHLLPSDENWGRRRRPVINVSWEDAVAYAGWLSEQTGKRYRLPTEAEWEHAVRAGTQTAYWWGKDIEKNRANCVGCGSQWDGKQTAPAGSFKPNPWGLHDTAGNVWEWVQDCQHENYAAAPEDGSKAWEAEGGGDCNLRVFRSSSWLNRPRNVRSARRLRNEPDYRLHNLSFRLAQDLD